MAKIYTPSEGYTGLIAGVSFTNGIGETDDRWLIQWFQNKGYVIEENQEKEILDDENIGNESEELSLEGLKVEELRDLAKGKNIEGYSRMKKEDLIKALSEHEEEVATVEGD